MNLFIPCGGKYSRFPTDGLPKYLRVMNDMRPMISWAIDGVRNYFKGTIKVAVRRADEDKWGIKDILKRYEVCDVMVLEEETSGPADTICKMIEYYKPAGPTMFHDCDCGWEGKWDPNINSIAVAWRETAVGDRCSKSWIRLLSTGQVTEIKEKENPTDYYCHGAYQVTNPMAFVDAYKTLPTDEEVYCSHVINKMISDGLLFFGQECNNPTDWGTYDKWIAYRRNTKVYIFDLDGVIFKSSGPYGAKLWEYSTPIGGVVEKLRAIKKSGGYIIVLTSRTYPKTEEMLHGFGIPYDRYVSGIPSGPRILINDFAESNPYPTAESINTERDSGSWIKMI